MMAEKCSEFSFLPSVVVQPQKYDGRGLDAIKGVSQQCVLMASVWLRKENVYKFY